MREILTTFKCVHLGCVISEIIKIVVDTAILVIG